MFDKGVNKIDMGHLEESSVTRRTLRRDVEIKFWVIIVSKINILALTHQYYSFNYYPDVHYLLYEIEPLE